MHEHLGLGVNAPRGDVGGDLDVGRHHWSDRLLGAGGSHDASHRQAAYDYKCDAPAHVSLPLCTDDRPERPVLWQ